MNFCRNSVLVNKLVIILVLDVNLLRTDVIKKKKRWNCRDLLNMKCKEIEILRNVNIDVDEGMKIILEI